MFLCTQTRWRDALSIFQDKEDERFTEFLKFAEHTREKEEKYGGKLIFVTIRSSQDWLPVTGSDDWGERLVQQAFYKFMDALKENIAYVLVHCLFARQGNRCWQWLPTNCKGCSGEVKY